MNHPDHWSPMTGRPIGGSTVVLDLDGVIADAAHRQHFLDERRTEVKDWRRFFAAAVDDRPLEAGRALAASVVSDWCVVILTARPHDLKDRTLEWLAHHQVRCDWLILRGRDHGGESTDWKRQQIERLIDRGATVELAADDDPRNVSMMRNLGIPTLYIASGYYDRRDETSTEFR